MLGAIIGDIVGSTREFCNVKTTDFELIPKGSRFTDDTVMTLAVARWLMEDPQHGRDSLVSIMQEMGRRYPNAGYGKLFRQWLHSDTPQPYGSYGNGAAMRVSPIGLYANSIEEALELALISASVTHNHPDGIAGAQAVAACVYFKSHEDGFDRKEIQKKIQQYVEERFGYDLHADLDEIRPNYRFDSSCKGSVPIAIMCALSELSAQKALRLAISMGGDSDTIACIATSIALAVPRNTLSGRGIPNEVVFACEEILPEELLEINNRFEDFINHPLTQSYYTGIDRLFAGEYPGNKNEAEAQRKIAHMVHFGVRHFVDLTEEGELEPYSHLLSSNCSYHRMSIPDCSVPRDMSEMDAIVDTIKSLERKNDGEIYIHCHGGVGRTGTVVACLYADSTSEPKMDKVIESLQSHFEEMPKSAYRRTPETPIQRQFIEQYCTHSQTRKIELKDKIAGCLMGGALGDALGYPVEFMSLSEIQRHYGELGIRQLEISRTGKSLISDDTQMTLFTANGLLMGLTRSAMRGIGSWPHKYIRESYIDWYKTQTEKEIEREKGYTWLRTIPELRQRRAPGTTCMNALQQIVKGLEPQNDSKGCGGIMRVAPIGLFDAALSSQLDRIFYTTDKLAEAGAEAARLTHQHPLGYLPAALMTLLIRQAVSLTPKRAKQTLVELIDEDIEIMMQLEGECHLEKKIFLKELTHKAIQLSQSDISDSQAVRELGEGWVAEEAWAISIYCTLRHIDNIGDAIAAAVNHNGDSDSTGAITGNIMGAIYGYESIRNARLFCPDGQEIEDVLELSNVILSLAEDLYTGCIISEYDPIDTPEKERWYKRYCEMKPAGI